jgi:O-antigen/teichoic acid export membrane protein
VEVPLRTPLLRRLLEGSLWSTISLAFMQGSTVLGNMAAARALPREEFGAYAAALTTIQLGGTLLVVGLGYTATKYVAEFRATAPDRAGRILGSCVIAAWGMGLVGAVSLLLGAPLLGSWIYGRPELAEHLRLAAPAVLLSTGNLGLMGALNGLSAFKSLGRLGVWSGVTYLCLVLLGLALGGERGAILGIAGAGAFQAGLSVRFLLTEARAQGLKLKVGLARVDRRIWRDFGLPGALSGLTAAPALWLVQAAIVRQPEGLEQLGEFLAAMNLMSIVLLLPYIVNTVGTTLLNELRGADDGGGFRRLFGDNLRVTVIAGIGGAGVIAFGGPVLLSAFGSGFRAGYPVLLVLLVASIPEAVTIALNQLLQARAKMWQAVLAINVPRDVLMPVIAWQCAPSQGAIAGAVAYLIGRLVAMAVMLVLVRRLRVVHLDTHSAA